MLFVQRNISWMFNSLCITGVCKVLLCTFNASHCRTTVLIVLYFSCLQELLQIALKQERELSQAAVERAVEKTREKVQQKMEDLIKVSVTIKPHFNMLNYFITGC